MCPSISHSSSAMCGANGDSISTSASSASFRTASVSGRSSRRRASPRCVARRAGLRVPLGERVQLVDQLHQRRHAVFRCTRGSRSSVTRRMVSCVLRRSAPLGVGQRQAVGRRDGRRRRTRRTTDRPAARRARGSGSCPRGRRRSTRFPSRAARRTSRTAAARRRRTSAIMSSGSTTLPFDFDMTSPSLSTIPCVSRRVNGSSWSTMPRSRKTRAEEARVDQVQDGVLDAAAVEIDRAPSTSTVAGSNGSSVVLRIAEAVEVPGRVDERVHRVGLAPGRAAARRAGRR